MENAYIAGPDGRAYEIATVASETAISLKSNYQGATASGQTYTAFPTRSLANEIVDRLNTLISNFQGVVDGPGSGKFPSGTVAAPGVRFEGDDDTGMRRVGANEVALVAGGVDQIKMKAGIASGAAVQTGKADVTPGRLMRADYGYSRGNAVGTVAQASGVSTGAIIERGSNASGSDVRFADGTPICWVTLAVGSIIAHGTGVANNPYRTTAVDGTRPATFSAPYPVAAIPACLPPFDNFALVQYHANPMLRRATSGSFFGLGAV